MRQSLTPILQDALGLEKDGFHSQLESQAEMPPYKDLSEADGIVVSVNIRKCLVTHDLHRLFTQTKATLKAFSTTYPLISDEDQARFPDVVQKLGCDLKELPLLSYLKLSAGGRCCLPASFMQNVGLCCKLRTLLLRCRTIDFGDVPFECAELERISILETSVFAGDCVGQPVNLAGLNRLKAVFVFARRPLILPFENSALVALELRGVQSLENHESLALEVLRATDCTLSMIEPIITRSKKLRELAITYTSRTDLKNFFVDAREMNYLSLTNVILDGVLSSAEKPLTALCLNNAVLVGRMARGDFIHAKSLYFAYNHRCQPSSMMAKISPTALKCLVFRRDHRKLTRLSFLDQDAMTTLTRVKDNLEVFATFAPIEELPRMPKLRWLGLYSEEQLLHISAIPRGLHLGLSNSSMDHQTLFSNVPAHYLLGKAIETIAYYENEYRYWEAMNERTDVLNFKPYSFDWTY